MKILAVMANAVMIACCLAQLALAQDVPKGRVEDVPDDIRQLVKDRLAHTFLYPMLVIWKFDFMQPYPTEGMAICGRLNFPNSTRKYVGEQHFFAHVTNGHAISAGIVALRQNEDPVLANANAYKIACGDG